MSTDKYTPHEIEAHRLLRMASMGYESIIRTPVLAGDSIILLAIRIIKERKDIRGEEEYTVMRRVGEDWIEP